MMKLFLIGILILMVSVPSVMGHPQIVGSTPGEIIPHEHEFDEQKAQREFFIILIGAIGITLLITVMIVYGKDIILIIKKQ